MSSDHGSTSPLAATVALVAGLACWSPAVSQAARVFEVSVAESRMLMPGVWGGDHIRMVISRQGAQLEYDCATGAIDRPIVVDASGKFSAKGSYAEEHHGPRRDGETTAPRVVYAGRVNGETMTLTVTMEAGARRVGRFTLKRGNDPLLTKCR